MAPESRFTISGDKTGSPPVSGRRRAKRWLRVTGAGFLIAVVAAATVYWTSRSEAPPHYMTAPVDRGAVARAITASGTVNPVLTIIVGTYVSGVIQNVFCDYNTKVTKGQVCAKIDPRPYQTIVDQNAAQLETARAQLAKDEASLAYAKLNYDRNRGLVGRGVVSQDVVDSAKSAYDQAQAQVALDKATIGQREAALDAAKVNLGYTDIVSPVDGTVVSRNVTVGQTVAASFQTPTLFLIATDLTKMQVDTNVSESDIGGVKVGDKASFTVEAFPNRTFSGTVVQVRQAPQTVQNVVTYDVVVAVANEDLALKPGMTATTRIVIDERSDVLRVPDQALRFSPTGLPAAGAGRSGAARVWMLRDGKAVAVPVQVGLDDDTNAEILGGDLKAGDHVIIGEQPTGTRSSARPRFFF